MIDLMSLSARLAVSCRAASSAEYAYRNWRELLTAVGFHFSIIG
jgi:hypothetical protein